LSLVNYLYPQKGTLLY